jgi:hypothetical protein
MNKRIYSASGATGSVYFSLTHIYTHALHTHTHTQRANEASRRADELERELTKTDNELREFRGENGQRLKRAGKEIESVKRCLKDWRGRCVHGFLFLVLFLCIC